MFCFTNPMCRDDREKLLNRDSFPSVKKNCLCGPFICEGFVFNSIEIGGDSTYSRIVDGLLETGT
jgi:hypothetical protein